MKLTITKNMTTRGNYDYVVALVTDLPSGVHSMTTTTRSEAERLAEAMVGTVELLGQLRPEITRDYVVSDRTKARYMASKPNPYG